MGLYTRKYNPVPNTSLVPLAVMWHVKDNVSTYNNLPITGNGEGDLRVTTDTDILYVWSISSSSGLLTDWKAVGTISSIDWSNITNKPSSSVSDIDDAVSKKHAHTNLSILNNIQEALTTTLKNSYDAYAEDIKNNSLNIMLNAFRIAQIGSLTIFNMVKGIMDEYEDESGVDLLACENQEYNSVNDYYTIPVAFDIYTKLILHFNNDLIDSATSKIITNNGVTFSTTNKFGGYSANFNGSGYLSVADSSDFAFGTGDFTIDCWINPNVLGTQKVIIGQENDSIANAFYMYLTTTNKLAWYDGSTEHIGSISINSSSWQHVAIIRESGTVKLFVDGVLDISVTDTRNLTSQKCTIGNANFPFSAYFNGLIDEIRVSKGIARWTSTFTPPASEYSSGALPSLKLVSKVTVAQSIPTSARIVLFEEDIDAIIINTDLKAFISRDDGTTWTEAVLDDEGNYITGARILSDVVDLSTQPSGSDMRYKITTANNKNLKIHGTSVSWK